MGLTKFAAFAIEAAELAPGAPEEIRLVAIASVIDRPKPKGVSLQDGRIGFTRQAHRHQFDYVPRPGFLYVRSRAISSRINDNFDGFPAEEIKKAYRTFIGKPVFVNHNNENHRRARGVIIDAVLHEDVNPDGTPDTWTEVLMEVDAVRFPKLAQAVLAGHIDRTSMGTDVAYSICTFCGNKASTPLQYCAHIPRLKGKRIRRTTASGGHEFVLVAEMCFGLGFFENSLLVEPPADPTAYAFLDQQGLVSVASVGTDLADISRGVVPAAPVLVDLHEAGYITGTFTNPRLTDSGQAAMARESSVKVAMLPLADLQHMERVLEKHLGHYDGNISWLLQNRPDATAEQIAGKIEDRNAPALRKMTGHEGYIVDKDVWWPKLVAATQAMLDEIRSGWTTEAALAVAHHSVADRRYRPQVLATVGTARVLPRSIRPTALGEIKAPPEVDTLRDAKCPVCGEEDGYNGVECAVCQFVKPPDMFMDPDTDLAGKVDLRQQQQDGISDMEDAMSTGDLVCDNCGTEFNDVDAGEPELPEQDDETVLPKADEKEVDPVADPSIPPKKDEIAEPPSPQPKQPGAPTTPDDEKQKKELPGQDGTDPATDQDATVPGAEDADVEEPETTQPKAGDTCPDCGKGKLQDKAAPVAPEGDKPPFAKGEEAQPDKSEGEPPKDEEGSKDQADKPKPDAEEDGDEDDGKPPWMKKKDKKESSHRGSIDGPKEKSTAMAPRPFHIVAAEQQASIDYIAKGMERIASVAGIDLSDLQGQRQQRVAKIRSVALEDPQVNPTQPPGPIMSPTPPAEAPAQTTEQAASPTATDDPQNIGASPLTNVAPDAQTALSDTGVVLDAPLDLNEQDVTKPVAGTEQVRPTSEVRTETEIRAGTGDSTSTMFPLQGDFAQQPTLASQGVQAPTPMEQAQARLFAGQRLANLRRQAGISQEDPMVLAQQIATNAALTDGAIMAEIETLTQVVAHRPTQQQQVIRPVAQQRRTTPSLVGGGLAPIEANLDPATGGLTRPTDDEFMWDM